jgi:hypothetical protein
MDCVFLTESDGVAGDVFGIIDHDHLRDLEAHLTRNPAPPTLGESTAGRRRIEEMSNSGHRRPFRVIFETFQFVLAYMVVVKNVAGVLMNTVLNFGGDQRRWTGGAWGSRAAA